MKYLILVVFFAGLFYLAIPESNILPASESYFTDNQRTAVTAGYSTKLQKANCSAIQIINPFCYIKPLKINHSTNLASAYFPPQQQSTYLEEYFYPLRGSIIVNGYEPFDKNGKAFNKYSNPLVSDGKQYFSRVTVASYNSSIAGRLFIYFLIWISIYWEIKLFKKLLN